VADPGFGFTKDATPEQILGRMTEGVFALNAEWEITYANDRAQAVLTAAMDDGDIEEQLGVNLWSAVPAARDTVFEERFRTAMTTQEMVQFDAEYRPLGKWFNLRVYPSASGISVYFREITEMKRLQRERAESLQALQRLYAVSAEYNRAFKDKLEEILTFSTDYLDVANGFLTRIDDGVQRVEAAVTDDADIQAGVSCPLEEAYCKRTVEMGELLTVVNAADEGWRDDPAYDRFEFDTYIGGRVEANGELYGTLCFAATEPRDRPFTDTERTFVELLTRWVSYEIERERTTVSLQRERDRLDQFASTVSHDLRNPLAVLQGWLEMAEESGDPEQFERCYDAVDRMDRLIDDLLVLARRGVVVRTTEAISLNSISEEAWTMIEAPAATLGIETDQAVDADRDRLKQLLENLFRNAIDHAGEDVTVTVGELTDTEGFYIADDGPGIPADQREQVFDTGFSTKEAGTGLGLGIVAEIVDAHGWEVRVTEAATGGARFEITTTGTTSAETASN
jgi:signal transduction histidine kinase